MRAGATDRPRHESAKGAIRNAAAELFADKGFAATSTREICQRAGVTKPVLYYHFGNKEELYEELVLDTFNEYQKDLRRATHRGRTTREKLVEAVTAMFAFLRRNRTLSRMAMRMVFAPERESPAINYLELAQVDQRFLAEIVREGLRRREIRGQEQAIAGAIHGIAMACVQGFLLMGQPTLDRTLARNVIDLIMDGCASKSTGR
jgi:TetR/AcrR family transcriptional regulator